MNAHQTAWEQIVTKARADQPFKQRLLASPHAVLKEHGLEVHAGVQVKVVEDTAALRHVILPAAGDELSEEDLRRIAGGKGFWKTSIGGPIGPN